MTGGVSLVFKKGKPQIRAGDVQIMNLYHGLQPYRSLPELVQKRGLDLFHMLKQLAFLLLRLFVHLG